MKFNYYNIIQFDWQGFINYMYSTSGLTVPPNIEVVITTPVYFDRLDTLLRNTDIKYVHLRGSEQHWPCSQN